MNSRNPPKPARPRPDAATRERALVMLEAGHTISETARECEVLRLTVRAWRDSPEGTRRMAAALAEWARHAAAQRAARANANAILCAQIERAARVLADGLEAASASERRLAAESILDRQGMPKSTKLDATVAPALDLAKLSDAELAQLEALTEKARPEGGA